MNATQPKAIYIDADACPVKDIIISEGIAKQIPIILVTSISHFSTKEQPFGVETIYVDTGAEAADYRIMRLLKKDDLLVTQDYGLASLALAKGAIVIHHSGYRYTSDNIDRLLQDRYLSAMVRKSGKRTKGPKPFTEENRSTFRQLLTDILSVN
ncbi:hypothetical protein SAMN04488700_1221 [Carnobacterium iners]|uniref:UPF0178 protein SAMN04488700_1221 n=1 Tax=Carnobacterium iners TaxID=1073423 RepID=A0A1X7N148_9LACT|nr:YaiI/YqxD family protein [Carnobacterium iners]SEK22639.1 hypothetical protein SAMN04488114_101207 [Carnobacterium iners]SMH31024.1 hypothetical protein SAMN04488700_1221 [Carnobacterium iners]